MVDAEYKPPLLHWMPDDPGESLVMSYPIRDAGPPCCDLHDAHCELPDDQCCGECPGILRVGSDQTEWSPDGR